MYQKIKKIIFFLVILALCYIAYLVYYNETIIYYLTSFPKIIAFLVGILVIMFPHDYEKVPEIISYVRGNNI